MDRIHDLPLPSHNFPAFDGEDGFLKSPHNHPGFLGWVNHLRIYGVYGHISICSDTEVTLLLQSQSLSLPSPSYYGYIVEAVFPIDARQETLLLRQPVYRLQRPFSCAAAHKPRNNFWVF